MATRIPSLNWLRVFEAAARTGSFARAAERLAMSPPAVSQQIRALEGHLGRPLFDRQAAGVTLTEAGRRLLAVVSDALGRMETAAAEVAAPGQQPLVIGASSTLAVGWLTPRLPRFKATNPDVIVELHGLIGRSERVAAPFPLLIVFGAPPPGMDATRLFGERLFPVAVPELAAGINTTDDLLDHPLIEVADHRKNWAHVLGRDVLPQEANVTYADTTLNAAAMAASGLGLALARPPASDDVITRYGLVPCLPGFEMRGVEDYHVVHTSGVPLSDAAARFLAWVTSEAAATADAQGV
ncbi:MAG: LysR family transcriptional regulator [Pseudomonadota bacterium]